jgi:hypothetical protein
VPINLRHLPFTRHSPHKLFDRASVVEGEVVADMRHGIDPRIEKENSMPALIVRALLLTGALCLSVPEAAAQAYRCGNVYQDSPCSNGPLAKPVMGSGQRSAASNPSGTSRGVIAGESVCDQRGADSLKIVWARESGVTKEKAMAEAADANARKLVTDVYRVRGAALDVRARIEAECKAELEERAKMLALHEAMTKAGVTPGGSAPASNPREGELAEKRATAEQLAADQQSEARAVKAKCDRFESQLATNRSRQRVGGGTGTMESMRREQMELERQSRAAGC